MFMAFIFFIVKLGVLIGILEGLNKIDVAKAEKEKNDKNNERIRRDLYGENYKVYNPNMVPIKSTYYEQIQSNKNNSSFKSLCEADTVIIKVEEKI